MINTHTHTLLHTNPIPAPLSPQPHRSGRCPFASSATAATPPSPPPAAYQKRVNGCPPRRTRSRPWPAAPPRRLRPPSAAQHTRTTHTTRTTAPASSRCPTGGRVWRTLSCTAATRTPCATTLTATRRRRCRLSPSAAWCVWATGRPPPSAASPRVCRICRTLRSRRRERSPPTSLRTTPTSRGWTFPTASASAPFPPPCSPASRTYTRSALTKVRFARGRDKGRPPR